MTDRVKKKFFFFFFFFFFGDALWRGRKIERRAKDVAAGTTRRLGARIAAEGLWRTRRTRPSTRRLAHCCWQPPAAASSRVGFPEEDTDAPFEPARAADLAADRRVVGLAGAGAAGAGGVLQRAQAQLRAGARLDARGAVRAQGAEGNRRDSLRRRAGSARSPPTRAARAARARRATPWAPTRSRS